jgi:glycosyltransferase involved in cell wall biosynthesis|nr:putative glycosyltransferase [uncultured bacterium]
MCDLDVELSVVIPVYRNADTLRALYWRLRMVLDSLERSWELIFINDASPDGSGKVLGELVALDPRVVAVELACNVGQGRATWVGLRKARGRFTVVMDADLQDPPEGIPVLLEAMEREHGRVAVVFGGRRGRYEGILRLVTGFVFRRLLALVCGVPPDAGAFCLMTAEAREQLLCWNVPRPHIPTLVGCSRLRSESVPVLRHRRPSGSSAYGSWTRWRLGLGLLWQAVRLRLDPARYRGEPNLPEPVVIRSRECVAGASGRPSCGGKSDRDA